MKKLFMIMALISMGLYTSAQGTCQINNSSHFEWSADIYIAPFSTVSLPGSCFSYYPPGQFVIDRVDLGAMILHGTGVIPRMTPSATPCPPGVWDYCPGSWLGDETNIGLPPIPSGWTVVRVVLTKMLTPSFRTQCPIPYTITVEVDEFSNSGNCNSRDKKVIVCPLGPGMTDGRLWFQLDHVVTTCNYCADYGPAQGVSGINILTW